MMSRRLTKTTATVLVLGILLMLGVTTGSAVAHEIQHAHHTASMHGTGVCAWMCASANTLVAAAVLPSAVAAIENLPVPQDLRFSSTLSPNRLQARAPPFSL